MTERTEELQPGRMPIPTALRTGSSARPSRINPREPQPGDTTLTMPSWLSNQAKAVWKRAVRELKAMYGVGYAADRDMLTVYCCAVVYMRQAAELLDKSNVVVVREKSGGGSRVPVSNPAGREFERYARIIRGAVHEFGFSPAARTRIETLEDPTTPLDDGDQVPPDAEVLDFLARVKDRQIREGEGAREAP